MKKIAVFLMTSILLSILGGCGSESDVPEVMPKQNFASSEDGDAPAKAVFESAGSSVSYPLESEGAELLLSIPYDSAALLSGDQQLLDAWTSATGVTIMVDVVASKSYSAYLNSAYAGGDIPDIMLDVPGYLTDTDCLLELDDYLSDYAPNYIDAVNALPGGPQAVSEEDGSLLRMYQLMESPTVLNGYGLVLRQDWMDELGISSPETYADYHDLLLAMKNQYDPLLTLALPQSGVTGYNNLCAGYGISLGSQSPNSGFYQVDGVIHYGPLEDGFEDYLTMLHQWYQEGILNSSFLDSRENGTNSYLMEIAKGDYGAFFISMDRYENLVSLCDFSIVPAMDPVESSGDISHLAAACESVTWASGYSIDSDTDYPELAVQTLDWLYTQDAMLLGAYGTEGESYTVEDGQPTFTALITDNTLGLSPADAIDAYTASSLSVCYSPSIVALSSGAGAALEIWNQQKDGSYMLPEGITMTQKESEEYTFLASDISTYIDSVIPQFIIGERNISELPDVIAEIREMDITRCMEIWQNALDRFNEMKAPEE